MIFGERIRLRAIEREDLQLILHHGFNDLNLNRIFLRVNETNPGAVKSYENDGFVH